MDSAARSILRLSLVVVVVVLVAPGAYADHIELKKGDRLTEQFVVFPNLTQTGEYRVNFDAAATTAITSRIGWVVTVSDRFLSNPPLGLERNDLIVTTGITFNLGRGAK